MEQLKLPRGFRFQPTDVEVIDYLKRKVKGKTLFSDAVAELDVYKHAPWDLPRLSVLKTCRDNRWYFFCPTVKKFAKGDRLNRTSDFGQWKTTGKDKSITYNRKSMGMMKTLVFYQGKARDKTDWIIHEYRLPENTKLPQNSDYVFCVVVKKHGYEEFIDDEIEDEDDENLQVGMTSSDDSPTSASVLSADVSPDVTVPTQAQESNINYQEYLNLVSDELFGSEDDRALNNDGQGDGNFGFEISEQDIDFLREMLLPPVTTTSSGQTEDNSNSPCGQYNYGGSSGNFFPGDNYAPSN